jgi:serine-type D-Ala-D-Ala endopeptidase (penicillin-binding protein 7)
VVRQKFKLSWLFGCMLSVLVSVSMDASAATRTQTADKKVASKPAVKSASKSASKASVKSSAKKANSSKRVASQKKAGKSVAKSSVRSGSRVARASTQSRGRTQVAARASQRSAKASVSNRGRAMADAPVPRPGLTQAALVGGSESRFQAAPSGAPLASRASYGQLYGLHQTQDPLELKSSVAFVIDQETNEVLLSKNSDAVLPIASLTKLMTALVVLESRLALDELITITEDDIDTEKNSSSRLAVGTTLSRGEALHLALMASENRAAHALGRTAPGGMGQFIHQMNAKARQLGMGDSRYVDPTGLNSRNQSSAKDLATLVKAAYNLPTIRELSTSPEYSVQVGSRQVRFGNTNSLVRNPVWDIGLQKTGYIVEAGRCLVMQARMAGRKLIMVFLDSSGKYSRQADAERVRRWIETGRAAGPSASARLPARHS